MVQLKLRYDNYNITISYVAQGSKIAHAIEFIFNRILLEQHEIPNLGQFSVHIKELNKANLLFKDRLKSDDL